MNLEHETYFPPGPHFPHHHPLAPKLQALAGEGKFDPAQLAALGARHQELSEELGRVFHELMALREEMAARAAALRKATVEPALARTMAEIARTVADPRVEPYLAEVKADLIENLEQFANSDRRKRMRSSATAST